MNSHETYIGLNGFEKLENTVCEPGVLPKYLVLTNTRDSGSRILKIFEYIVKFLLKLF